MVQILAGAKGEGKTKKLLQMANDASKVAKGNIVFIDDDNRHMYDLHYNIRFIETSQFTMEDYKVFFGFICGILCQDSDVEHVYIDGVGNIVEKLPNEDLVAFTKELEAISAKEDVNFTMIVSAPVDTLPEELKPYLA